MKKILILLLISTTSLFAEIPKSNPNTWVVDNANVLHKDEEISNLLLFWEKQYKTGVEYAVVTVNSLEGEDVGSYATKIGNEWGVGKKGSDNGVVIVIAPNEHKLFVATGYGMEEYLTDYDVSKYIDEAFPKEELRAGNFDSGLSRLINLIHNKVGKMSKAERDEWKRKEAVAKKIESDKRSEAFINFLWNLSCVLFFMGVTSCITYLILRSIKRKKAYKKIVDEINYFNTIVTQSKDLEEYKDSSIINDVLIKTKTLYDLSKTPPSNIIIDTEDLLNSLEKQKENYVAACMLIGIKRDLDTSSTFMIDELNNHTDHPGVNEVIKKIITIKNKKVIESNLKNENDSMRDDYKKILEDIKFRKSIENKDIDFNLYESRIKEASEIANKLGISTTDMMSFLENAINLKGQFDNLKKDGITKHWVEAKRIWNLMHSNISNIASVIQNVDNTQASYNKALISVPKQHSTIVRLISDCESIIYKSGVKISTKNSFQNFKNSWLKIVITNLSTLDTIKMMSTLSVLESQIEDIIKKVKKNHKDYVEDEERSSYSSSVSSSYSSGSSSSYDSSSSNSSYGGGSFGGGGSGSDW